MCRGIEAKNVGITPIWLKHYSVERNWVEPAFDVIQITQLDEVIEIEKLIKNR